MIKKINNNCMDNVAGGFDYLPYTSPETGELIGYRIIFKDPNDLGNWNNYMRNINNALKLADSMVADQGTMNPVYSPEVIQEFQNFVDQQSQINAQDQIVQPRRHRRHARLNNCQIL